MKALIAGFSKQLKAAKTIGEESDITPKETEIKNVVISGLGGSGIGGAVVSNLIEGEADVPLIVNKNYFVPHFVNENTLVIVVSYSGNTEETLTAMRYALERKAQVAAISSGGKVVEAAKSNHLNLIQIPGGMPPRAAFGYSFVQLLYMLYYHGIINEGFKHQLEASINLLEENEEEVMKEAEAIAGKLHGKLPVIYASADFEGVATRFRQQLNENAKVLCWHHVLPEMNHNELVGWRNKNEKLAVLYFRNDSDYDRIQKRMDINKEIIREYTPHIFEIWSKGKTDLEKSLYLIHFGDWVSYFLAIKNQVDPVEVKVIDYLKAELAKS